MVILIFFAVHWYVSLFFQSFFHHRYAAHQLFTMTKGWERAFFIVSYIFQGSSYLSPYAYGVMHRMHHSFADTEKDPHSPKFSSNIFSMMWHTKIIYSKILKGKMVVEEKFKSNMPKWMSFDLFTDKVPVRLLWVGAYVAFYIIFATHWWMYLLLPIHAVMGPFHGAIINWFAHKIGTRPNKVNDTSTNLMPVDLFMMGEGYHNNHHKFPKRPNFGLRWHEFDPVYPFILLFNKLGIIRLTVTS
jgi:stearoyl-CoA desaturase (delta-9 desaturase)